MIERLRRIGYFLAYAVATIPLWHYIRDGRILAVMVAIVTFAYVMVVLSSVQAAQPILSSEKAKTTLPRWLPNKPKYHNWWMIVRHTLKWHLLLVIPKMGLALGFSEILHNYWLRAIPFHQSYSYNTGSYNGYFPTLYPQWETVIIAHIVLLVFAIFETSMLTAIIIRARFLKFLIQKTLFISVTRISSIFIFLGLGLTIIYPIEQILVPYDIYCQPLPDNGQPIYIYSPDAKGIQFSRCPTKRILDTAYLMLMTPYEQGILLSANVMRPWGQITYAEVGRGDSLIHNGQENVWDNRPFVARQIVAGLLGLMVYAGATWVILWFVEEEDST